MPHPTEGVLRRLLDEPAGVADADHHHAAACARCQSALVTIDEDLARVASALALDDTEIETDLDAAWRRLVEAAAQADATQPVAPARATPLGPTRGRRIIAGLAATAVLAGASAAAATGWLPIFRTEEVAPVRLSPADLNALPDLSTFGRYEVTGDPDLREVPDAAAAAAATGLDIPEVTALPRGIDGDPTYQVGGEVTATFTFSTALATRAAEEVGAALPPPPPGLDGAQVRLVAGPAVAQVWRGTTGPPALIVGRAVAPTAFSSGVPYDTVRDYLLSLPGLSDDLADQLRAFDSGRSTLPLPVPDGRIGSTSSAQVGGVPATVLTTSDGAVAAVVWVDDGVVTAVAGSVTAGEALAVARSLR